MKEVKKTVSFPLVIISLLSIFYIIYIWASLLIPLVVAFIISFAIISLSSFFQKKWLNKFLSFTLSLVTFFVFFWVVWQLINSNIQQITNNSEIYQEKLSKILSSIESTIKKSLISDNKSIMSKLIWNLNYNDILSKINIPFIVSSFAWAVTSIFKSTWIIIFYTIFILLESRFFYKKIDLMFSRDIARNKVLEVLW
jgi:predicted PurR-regulated permease PerM